MLIRKRYIQHRLQVPRGPGVYIRGTNTRRRIACFPAAFRFEAFIGKADAAARVIDAVPACEGARDQPWTQLTLQNHAGLKCITVGANRQICQPMSGRLVRQRTTQEPAGRYFFLATNLIGEIADRKSSGFISGAASDMVAQEAAPGTIPFAHCSVILVKTGTAHHASEEAAIADGNVSCGPKAGVR